MKISEFEIHLASYGTDLARWPSGLRDAAELRRVPPAPREYQADKAASRAQTDAVRLRTISGLVRQTLLPESLAGRRVAAGPQTKASRDREPRPPAAC